MAKTGVRYVDRELLVSPYHIGLCLYEEHYLAEMKRLKVTDAWPWPDKAKAETVRYKNSDNQLTCIVCVRGWEHYDEKEVFGLLVHEATHVWQRIMEEIGETEPGREIEAYGIQNIAQNFFYAYKDMTKDKQ